MELKTRFLELEHVAQGNAVEILAALVNALEKLGVEDYKDRLVGFGEDSASVNRGEENDVVGLPEMKFHGFHLSGVFAIVCSWD